MSSDAAREKNRMILRSTDAACEKVIPKSTDAATCSCAQGELMRNSDIIIGY